MSRSVLTLVLLAVVAAAAFLFLGNPFGPKAGSEHGAGNETEAPGEVGMAGMDGGAAAPEKPADVGLAGSASERGKGGVRVRLLSFKDRAPLVGQIVKLTLREGEVAERTTGEDGRLAFHDLRASKAWTLTIEGKGFSPVEMKGVAVPANGVNDLGDLLLGDKVVLKGRVIDTRGRPIPGAAVSAYVGGGFDMSQGIALAMAQSALDNPLPSDEAQTDVEGVFALAALTPGRAYEIKAKRPGYAMSVQADLVVSPDRNNAVLTIVLGEGATVKGKVVDEGGKPVAKATVIAMEDLGMRAMRGGTALKRDYALTQDDGTYVLDTLTRGARYRFGVSAKGYAPIFDTMTGGLTVEAESERNFTLVKGGNIEGRVTDKTTGAGVAGARVLAVVGNLMRFGPGGPGGGRRGGGFGGGQPAGNPADDEASTQIVLTGDDGSFRIEGMKPGPVALAQVKAAGYGDYAASVFATMMPPGMGGGGPAPAPWGEVRAGETLSVAVELEAGGSVTGRVMAATGAGTVPVAGAQVSVIQLSMMAMLTGFATATTADDGSFRVDGIRPGRYTVTATASGYVAPDAMAEGAAVEMPEGGGQVSKDIVMSAAGVIEGTVRDGKGAPVGAARVRTRPAPERGGRGFTGGMLRGALPGGGTKVVLTDADGKYRIDSVPGGEKQLVTAEADEFVPTESDPVEVRVGETRTVDLVLTGGGTLVGRVIDDRGGVVVGARLRIGHVDADAESQANLNAWRADAMLEPRVVFSGDDGRFEINRVPPGRTLLKVEKDGYTVFYRRDLLVRADDVLDNQVVTLTKGETLSGVVKGEDGKPLAGVTVAATKQANPMRGGPGGGANAEPQASDGTVEPQLTDRTDDQGRFTIENVPPGSTYSVLVWFAPGYRGYAQQDEGAIKRAVATGSRDVELTLKKMAEGEAPFPMGPGGPRPAGTGTPGMGGGRMPVPPAPGGPGTGGGTPPVPGMN